MFPKMQLPLDWPPPAPKDLPLELALKMGVAAGVGLWIAHVLGLDFPVYVLLAVATCVDITGAGSWLLSGYRLIGTLIGVPLAMLVVNYWSVTPFSAGLVMGGIVMACAPFGLRHSTRLAALIFAVGVTDFASEVNHWGGGRLLATTVGAIVSIVVSAVPIPHPIFRRHPHGANPDTPPGFIVGQE
ncbi:MAG: FUSC family protein [Acidimicrobiales bacterium]